jgi:predicted HTH domain antitoxin
MATVSFEVPQEVFAAVRRSPDEFAREVRLAAAVRWYSRAKISQERAAELAGMSRAEFLRALAHEKIDVFVVDQDDLQREIDRG